MTDKKCKICRRLGVKLFLKGDRCLSPKCSILKKSYPPGPKGKRRPKPLSEYGKELQEKQKVKNWYNLSETQFEKYVRDTLKKKKTVKNPAELLIQKLETRLDNVVFRLGFAPSHAQARQMVSHKHFMVNGRVLNVPSYSLKKGDKISIYPGLEKKAAFKNIKAGAKKSSPPSWLKLDKDKVEAQVVGSPNLEEVAPPGEISAVFEFFSR